MNPVPTKSESLALRGVVADLCQDDWFCFQYCATAAVALRMDLDEVGVYKQVFLIVNTGVTVLPLGFSMSAYYFLPSREPDQR
jgi:hypothetical protein